MKIHQPDFYQLIKIGDLIRSELNQKVQFVGKINEIDNDRFTISDSTGETTLLVSVEGLKIDVVIRVFGIWNGIELNINKVLLWDIPANNIDNLLAQIK